MIVITRYVVPAEEAEEFSGLVATALDALTARPGCTAGWIGRAVDDGTLWTLTTTWTNVGAYRRALSAYDVKVRAVPVMYRAVDEATAYEPVVTWSPDSGTQNHEPGRSGTADAAHPGE